MPVATGVPVSMASKSPPVSFRKSSTTSSTSVSCPSGAVAFHPSLLSPVKYQSDPMSATMTPYFFIASMMTCDAAVYPEVDTLDLRRRRKPIGGYAPPSGSLPAA